MTRSWFGNKPEPKPVSDEERAARKKRGKKSKRKGYRGEVKTVEWLRSHGIDAHRRAEPGDVMFSGGQTGECKLYARGPWQSVKKMMRACKVIFLWQDWDKAPLV